jgi:hypothetical protein
VVFHSDFEAGPDLRAALLDSGCEARVAAADAVGEEEAAELVAFVLSGGGLLLCGGDGPLLRALNLRIFEDAVGGAARPFVAGLEPVEVAGIHPVSGPGFALYRLGDECIALGAPRGEGRVAFLGVKDPPPALALGCLRWISRQI